MNLIKKITALALLTSFSTANHAMMRRQLPTPQTLAKALKANARSTGLAWRDFKKDEAVATLDYYHMLFISYDNPELANVKIIHRYLHPILVATRGIQKDETLVLYSEAKLQEVPYLPVIQ